MIFGNTNGFGILGLFLGVATMAIFGMLILRGGNFDIIKQQRTAPDSLRDAVLQAENLKDVLESKEISMTISSPVFTNATSIPREFTCDGKNISPPLIMRDVPMHAKSMVLIFDDPDAPGDTWVHWTVWNINPSVQEIPVGAVPSGSIEGRTSFGSHGYGGPCPHNGTHRYFFKLYALDTALNVPLTSEAMDLENAMKGHIIADAKLMGTYEKK